MLRALLFVGLGGGVGCMTRFGISMLMNKLIEHPFPLATFLVNLTGCFLIGLLFGFGGRGQWMQGDGWLILATGFCGGFTTFSAFALENVNLFQKQFSVMALLYAASSVVLGIILCRLGIWLSR